MTEEYGRASSRRRGMEAEERMHNILTHVYGRTEKLPNDINPDFILYTQIPEFDSIPPYMIECKSIATHASDYVGRIKISREQWKETLRRCEEKDSTPVVMVEINVWGSPIKLYYLLNNMQVQEKMGVNHASFTVWQIIKIGVCLDV